MNGEQGPEKTKKWQELKSPDGHVYYFNTETKESVWEKPAELGGDGGKKMETAEETKKRKAEFFQLDKKENPNVYVEGLPPVCG